MNIIVPTPFDLRPLPWFHAQAGVMTEKYDTLQPGCCVGYRSHTSLPGTLCCVVKSTLEHEKGWRLALSCEHVFYDDLRSRFPLRSPPSFTDVSNLRTVHQPGPGALKDPKFERAFGILHRSGSIGFDDTVNFVDAAVAWIDHSFKAGINLPVGRETSITAIGDAQDDMAIIKLGAATGLQTGRVIRTDATVMVNYEPESETDPNASPRRALFKNVVIYKCACEAGDSGAPVLDAGSGRLIGMHFAGKDDLGVFCPISTIFEKLSLKL